MTVLSVPTEGRDDPSKEAYNGYFDTPSTCLSDEEFRRRILGIWSANVDKSSGRNKDAVSQASAAGARLLCIQDPPKTIPYQGTGDFRLEYLCDRTLTAADNPFYHNSKKSRAKRAKFARFKRPTIVPTQSLQQDPQLTQTQEKEEAPYTLGKVAIYIRKDIPLKSCKIIEHRGPNSQLAMTLLLKTDAGWIRIHKVYNHNWQVDFDKLQNYFSGAAGVDILCGDLNARHSDWDFGKLSGLAKKSGDRLHKLIVDHGLTVLNTPGDPTYSRGTRKDRFTSVLALHIVGPTLKTYNAKMRVVREAYGFPSDHCVTEVTLDMEPDSTGAPKWVLPDEDEKLKKVLEDLKEQVEKYSTPEMRNYEELEQAVKDVMAILTKNKKKTWRKVKPRLPSKQTKHSKETKAAEQRLQAAQRKQAEHAAQNANSSPQVDKALQQETLRANAEFDKLRKKDYTNAYFTYIEDRDKWKASKDAVKYCQPKVSQQMGDIVVGEERFTTGPTKTYAIRGHLWRYTHDENGKIVKFFAGNTSQELHKLQTLKPGELLDIMKHLNSTSPGHDDISNDFLKLAAPILAPILEPIFNACFRLRYFPKYFKFEKTILLPKPGKKDYKSPKSWRPIALLPAVGKLLEKLLVNRYKQMNIELKLSPVTQHGAAGKCTTKALQCIISQVCRGWAITYRKAKKKVLKRLQSSLLSFDIQGAYNNVDRDILIGVLKEKKLPNWMVEITASFLSERMTTLELPGHEVEAPFYTHIGKSS